MSEKSGVSFNGHTLMLVQFSQSEDSRTYLDFDKIEDGCESLCRIYESVQINKKKAEDKDGEGKFEYELCDFLKFLDSLYDLGAMVYSDKGPGYMAHGREWIKAKIYSYMKERSTEK
jgi:hypothetical protein